jgi:hypothetical protein
VTIHNLSENVSQSSVPGSPATLLSPRQLLLVSALGIFFWFAFALVVRFGSALNIFGGVAGVVTFLMSIPLAWLLIVVIRAAATLSAGQLLPGMALSIAAAALCDGIVLTWMPGSTATKPARSSWAQPTFFGGWASS